VRVGLAVLDEQPNCGQDLCGCGRPYRRGSQCQLPPRLGSRSLRLEPHGRVTEARRYLGGVRLSVCQHWSSGRRGGCVVGSAKARSLSTTAGIRVNLAQASRQLIATSAAANTAAAMPMKYHNGPPPSSLASRSGVHRSPTAMIEITHRASSEQGARSWRSASH
jgi:hypothetical protein